MIHLPLFYFISGNTNNAFVIVPEISKDNFTLRNQNPLDHETINLYLLTLEATNRDTNESTEVNVTVNILDVNDNPPIFNNRYIFP